MSIAHVVPSLETRHGGPSRSVRELAAAQARLGADVGLYTTTSDTAGTDPAEERVHVFARGRPAAFCPSRGLRAALRRAAPGVVHHHALWLRTLHYARLAASHGVLVISPRGMMSRWAWSHHRARKRLAAFCLHPGALARAAGWHATSEREAEEIRSLGFAQPICVAPNGITDPGPEALAAARTYWESAVPAATRRPVALFYGRFHRKKRLLELIDLWLERAAPDWLLLVVGIPEEYSVEMLEEYVLRSQGAGRVEIQSGLGRPPPYAAASLFLLASHNENFGLAIAEAMAAGVPALVTDTTPWAPVGRQGVGWCVPWDDFGEALGAATHESRGGLQERGQRARAWVLSEYAWERPARALLDFYERLRGEP